MQTVKRRFFAMRNGVISDVLRKGGSPFKIIFGLNLPQIVEIASELGPDTDLARQLWADTRTRESMLLAPMLVRHDMFTLADAKEWVATIPAAEVADILCHKLLRYCPFAVEFAGSLAISQVPMDRYVAVRLMFNLVYQNPAKAAETAAVVAEKHHPLTDRVAAMLADEAACVAEFDKTSDFR